MTKKILFADCQVFQEPAWHRGMGKYSLSLLEGLLQSKTFTDAYELKLLLNNNLQVEDSMLATVNEALAGAEIVRLDLPTYSEGKSLRAVQKECQDIIDMHFDQQYKDNDVTFIIMSLFLQFACPVYPMAAKKILLYYDLIMLQYYRMYLGLGASEQHFAHYKTLFASDVILSISKTVANDLTIYLGIPKDKIKNIDGAPIKRTEITAQIPSTDINSKYILMPSGGDPRKNNYKAMQGFALFNAAHNNQYKIVLTSMFGDGMRKHLLEVSNDAIFTGNVEESELAWLYDNCEAVLFAPEYEGLGLPILEAADHNKPVACSDISVFREMSEDAFYYFDHMSPEDIARALDLAINKSDWNNKKSKYPAILHEYSWKHTVDKTLSAIIGITSNKTGGKKRLAVIAPNIQTNSFVGYYAALKYPEYAEEYTVDYYYDFGIRPLAVRPNHLAFVEKIHSVFELDTNESSSYKKVVAYIQNSSDSAHALPKALAINSEVELFSANLQNVFKVMADNKIITKQRYDLEDSINTKLAESTWLGSLINNSTKLNVYSNDAKKAITKVLGKTNLNVKTDIHTMELPQLPYTIARSSTAHETLLYISPSINVENVKDVIKRKIDSQPVDILFSCACTEEQELSIKDAVISATCINGPTDFETVNMIQRAKNVVILGGGEDTEAMFIMQRCIQLGVAVESIDTTSTQVGSKK